MIKISPDGKQVSDTEMQRIFDEYEAVRESIFCRYEMNEVIKYTKGVGVEIGCGLNKIHTAAIGINKVLTDNDFRYPYGAQIKAEGDSLLGLKIIHCTLREILKEL